MISKTNNAAITDLYVDPFFLCPFKHFMAAGRVLAYLVGRGGLQLLMSQVGWFQ